MKVYHMERPKRHADLKRKLRKEGISDTGAISGFHTKTKEFMTRKQAMAYAKITNQIKPTDKKELYSEDLW